uniref:Uncharacterized protein n=1 Tax=Mycena chlorophos TaxID=658473 RepID=A0ABQ0L691_MYCCL|nr:predicted protein [Mycena chlorophos]
MILPTHPRPLQARPQATLLLHHFLPCTPSNHQCPQARLPGRTIFPARHGLDATNAAPAIPAVPPVRPAGSILGIVCDKLSGPACYDDQHHPAIGFLCLQREHAADVCSTCRSSILTWRLSLDARTQRSYRARRSARHSSRYNLFTGSLTYARGGVKVEDRCGALETELPATLLATPAHASSGIRRCHRRRTFLATAASPQHGRPTVSDNAGIALDDGESHKMCPGTTTPSALPHDLRPLLRAPP